MNMNACNYQASTETLTSWSVLKRYDAEECKSSEATWLQVTWHCLKSVPVPLRPKATARDFSKSPNNKRPSEQTLAERVPVALARQCTTGHYTEKLSPEKFKK